MIITFRSREINRLIELANRRFTLACDIILCSRRCYANGASFLIFRSPILSRFWRRGLKKNTPFRSRVNFTFEIARQFSEILPTRVHLWGWVGANYFSRFAEISVRLFSIFLLIFQIRKFLTSWVNCKRQYLCWDYTRIFTRYLV